MFDIGNLYVLQHNADIYPQRSVYLSTKIEKHNYKNFKIVYSKEAKLNDTIVVKYTKNNSLINVCGFVDNQKVFAAELIYE